MKKTPEQKPLGLSLVVALLILGITDALGLHNAILYLLGTLVVFALVYDFLVKKVFKVSKKTSRK